jgi:hypothetical protein
MLPRGSAIRQELAGDAPYRGLMGTQSNFQVRDELEVAAPLPQI